METIGAEQLTRILQLSITPVALISGVGLLLLSMTNRIGRVIDRSRILRRPATGSTDAAAGDPSAHEEELKVLFRRARLLQVSIALIGMSIFLAVLTVVLLFAMHLFGVGLGGAILVVFAVCLTALVGSIVCFLGDIFLAIRWLRMSLDR